MTREWQPGDVASIKFSSGTERGMWVDDKWVVTGGLPSGPNYAVDPLVVIDPEDREQVERLTAAHCETFGHNSLPAQPEEVSIMQAALREFANPTPPKPTEPTGLGAVVEDADGCRWVRASLTSTVNHWRCADESGMGRKPYAKIDAVRVLSEGVTP